MRTGTAGAVMKIVGRARLTCCIAVRNFLERRRMFAGEGGWAMKNKVARTK
jgi:hypothetical protein